jgi:hypothetical protein
MQNINIQDEEKYGYSDIVDEMRVTIGFSSTVLIDVERAGLSRLNSERKKCSNSRSRLGYYIRRTSRMMIRNYQFGARVSYVSEFKIEDRDLMQLGKKMDGAHIF